LFSQKAIVAGKVKYGEEVLQSATVLLRNTTTLTNYKDEFSFSVKPGNYLLIITHAGYKKIEQIVIVDADNKKSFVFIDRRMVSEVEDVSGFASLR